jgi:hypothetical protein
MNEYMRNGIRDSSGYQLKIICEKALKPAPDKAKKNKEMLTDCQHRALFLQPLCYLPII